MTLLIIDGANQALHKELPKMIPDLLILICMPPENITLKNLRVSELKVPINQKIHLNPSHLGTGGFEDECPKINDQN